MVDNKTPQGLIAWEVLNHQILFDGSPWVRLIQEHVRLPNGVEIRDFYRVEITAYVTIFALTTDLQVAMVEHYKHGPGQVSLELPAGYIEPEDDPLAAAQRELREETGLVSEQWQPLGRYFIDGNRGCGWMYAFLALDARLASSPQHEETELLTLYFKSLDDVFELWHREQIPNVAASQVIGRGLLEVGYLRKR
jgi:8-oxo-dGTP pyrophosphatase MutT (NUDIX family)